MAEIQYIIFPLSSSHRFQHSLVLFHRQPMFITAAASYKFPSTFKKHSTCCQCTKDQNSWCRALLIPDDWRQLPAAQCSAVVAKLTARFSCHQAVTRRTVALDCASASPVPKRRPRHASPAINSSIRMHSVKYVFHINQLFNPHNQRQKIKAKLLF